SKVFDDDGDPFTIRQSEFPLNSMINGDVKLGEFYNKLYQSGTMLKVTGELADGISLTSVTAYRQLDNDLLTIISFPYFQDLQQDQLSQEIRLSGEADRL